MTLILNGDTGLSDVDGSAATPAIRGTDTNTGIFFPAADTIAFAEGGAEVGRFDNSGNLLVGTTSASTPGTGFISVANTFGFKNRIINGGMVIDQRNAGASVSVNTGANFYAVDRFNCTGEATDGVFSIQRSTTAPAGFVNSIIATVTTADASIGSAQRYILQQRIEGFNVADFGWGTASAQSVTLSFWVRSSVTGTFGGSFRNAAGDRSYPFTYTISAANTFEYKTITVAGDTTGTWATDNTAGIFVTWSLGVGSSLKTTAGAWTSGSYWAGTGSVDLISTLNATFYITGVQLERGSTATSFDFRSYGTELMLCQRYYQSMSIWISNAVYPYMFAVTKRAAPTVASTAGGFSLAGVTPSVDSFYASQTTGSQVTVTASSEL